MNVKNSVDYNGKSDGLFVETFINGYKHSSFFRGYDINNKKDVIECIQYFEAHFYNHREYEHYVNLPFGKDLPIVG